MLSSILLLLPALASAIPATPFAKRDTPPVDQIIIKEVDSSGTGCPQGSVSESLSTDGLVVTFGFDDFYAEIGPAAAQADKTKNCQLHLTLDYPGGFQYAVVDAVYHGYARLDPGVTGTFLSTYFFSQNAAQTTTTRSTISGADWVDGNVYTKEDEVESTVIIWSPCGAEGILNVNNRISLSATNSTLTGELSDDDATVSFEHQLHVAWQRCTPDSSGGGSFQTGSGSTNVNPREAQDFTIGPGSSTVVTPGSSSGGSTVITPGGDGGITIVTPGKE